MSDNLNVKRLESENNYLNYKIDKYTHLIVVEAFSGKNKVLIEGHVGKMINKKIQNEKLLEILKE